MAAVDERGVEPVMVGYDDVRCLKHTYKMTMNMVSTSKTRRFGLKSEVSYSLYFLFLNNSSGVGRR